MPTSNPWLNPFQRSFEDIKSQLISKLKAGVPEMTDFSEGNIFILIISIFAAIAEVLHFYIDNMAREAFLPTARRYSSLYKHAKLVDYHIKAAVPPSVDLTLYRNTGSKIEQDIVIPVNTTFKSNDGKEWLTSKTITWDSTQNPYSVKVPVVQKTKVSDVSLGTITSTNVIIYLGDLPTDQKYVEGSMTLNIGGIPWRLVDTFAYANSVDKVFKVELDTANKPYIVFGDGQFGMRPTIGKEVVGSYYITYGEEANLPENSFGISVPQSLTSIYSDISVSNLYPCSGGSNYETFDMLKGHIPLSVKTLGVAITKDDFEAIAKLVPGVDKAYVDYICGKFVNIYITPDGGGEASMALIDQAYDAISKSKVITTNISVDSTHTASIYLKANITGNKSFSKNDISDQVIKALVENYSYNTSDINKVVRLSDLYALIDNQSMVDYLTITSLYILGYPVPQGSPTSAPELAPDLNITYFNQTKFVTGDSEAPVNKRTLKVTITEEGYNISGVDDVDINVDGNYGQMLSISNNNIAFDITIGETTTGLKYNTGDSYLITLQPMNIDLVPSDFNIPIFKSGNIELTINEVV